MDKEKKTRQGDRGGDAEWKKKGKRFSRKGEIRGISENNRLQKRK